MAALDISVLFLQYPACCQSQYRYSAHTSFSVSIFPCINFPSYKQAEDYQRRKYCQFNAYSIWQSFPVLIFLLLSTQKISIVKRCLIWHSINPTPIRFDLFNTFLTFEGPKGEAMVVLNILFVPYYRNMEIFQPTYFLKERTLWNR